MDKKEEFSAYGGGEMCSAPRKSMVEVYFSAKNIFIISQRLSLLWSLSQVGSASLLTQPR